MADDRGQEREWESLKLYFEFFKHFTTLATAVTLILIATGQTFEVPAGPVVSGVVLMGTALLLSLIGMLTTVLRVQMDLRVRPGSLTLGLAVIIVTVFFSGLATLIALLYGIDIYKLVHKLVPF